MSGSPGDEGLWGMWLGGCCGEGCQELGGVHCLVRGFAVAFLTHGQAGGALGSPSSIPDPPQGFAGWGEKGIESPKDQEKHLEHEGGGGICLLTAPSRAVKVSKLLSK